MLRGIQLGSFFAISPLNTPLGISAVSLRIPQVSPAISLPSNELAVNLSKMNLL